MIHVSLIWAMASNRVIGQNNTLPWRLPREMRHFMDTTMGKPVFMGRRTFESMKAPLPGRTNIVLTSDPHYAREGVIVVRSVEEGLDVGKAQCEADGVDEVIVAGGAGLYEAALPLATRLYMTEVHADIEGDTWFPEFALEPWRIVESTRYEADKRHAHAYTITVLEKR